MAKIRTLEQALALHRGDLTQLRSWPWRRRGFHWHMGREEKELLPLAEKYLTATD